MFFVLVITAGVSSAPSALADSRLAPNQSLQGTITSNGGQFKLVMQSDCNLVLYGGGNVVLWRSGTAGKGTGCKAIMQENGNFVVETASNQIVWSSRTARGILQGNYLELQDDGNLVVYIGSGPTVPLWTRERLLPGQSLKGSQSDFINSLNNQFKLVMQDDCNLVLYRGSTSLWNTGTQGKGTGCTASVTTNGILVITSGDNKNLWSSTGQPYPSAAYLEVQNDGNLVLYAGSVTVPPTNLPLWATNTNNQGCPTTATAPTITVTRTGDNTFQVCGSGFGAWAGQPVDINVDEGVTFAVANPPKQVQVSAQGTFVTSIAVAVCSGNKGAPLRFSVSQQGSAGSISNIITGNNCE